MKYTKSLLSLAIKLITGKSITKVLFKISTLRYLAVHYLLTSVAGILNMLYIAKSFTEALNNSKQAERLVEIKTQLAASIKEILQH